MLRAAATDSAATVAAAGVLSDTAAPRAGMAPPEGRPPLSADGSFPAGPPQGAPGNAAESAAVTTETGAAPVVSAAQAVAEAVPAFSAAATQLRVPAIAGRDGVAVWNSAGELLVLLADGEIVSVNAQSDDGRWLAVETGSGSGWLAGEVVIAFGLERLATVEVPAAVQATGAAPVAAEETTTAEPASGGEEGTLLASAPVDVEASGAAGVAELPLTLSGTVTLTEARLNIRSGPATSYAVLAKVTTGEELAVVGRSATGDWLMVVLPDDPEKSGWVAAEYLALSGAPDTVPEVTVPASNAPETTAPVGREEAASTEVGAVLVSATNAERAPQTTAATGGGETGLTGKLAFQQSPGGMIYVYDLVSGALTALTNGFDPAISPDGTTVAFVREGGETGIYLIDSDGAHERKIFGERGSFSAPKWSPDGASLVFTRGDEYIECYQMGPNQCLTLEEILARMPSFDPASLPLVKEYQYKLSVISADGDNFHDVAALNSAKAADWSAAGIVYQSSAGLQSTADSADAVNQLVAFDNLNPRYADPDWQPQGGQIVFQIKGAAQTELWVVNPDGSGMAALTHPVTTLVDELPSNVAPAYSPDGQAIVFLSNRGENNAAGAWHLWVMDADGGNQRALPITLALSYTYGLEQMVSWGG
jgi:uncharacterized protein YraI